eukprot:734940-Prymnesium_polylepis.1
MWRSEPQPSPAVSAHAACQLVQSAQYCARSGMVEPVGSTGRSAGMQPCSARRGGRAAMTAYNCFRCG